MTSAVVLCGGKSRRMGTPKALLPFGDESLLARAVRIAGAVSHDLIVVGPAEIAAGCDARALADPGEGPLVAFALGLGVARGDRVLLLACDMPLVTAAQLESLGAQIGDHDACVPRVAGFPIPTCAIYSRDVVAVAERLVAGGARSLTALLDVLTVRWLDEIELRDAETAFLDCDTPEDYERVLALASRRGTEPT